MLTAEGGAARRARLRARLQQDGFDVFVTGNYRSVYYFTGLLLAPDAPCAFLMWADGTTATAGPGAEYDVEIYSAKYPVTRPHLTARSRVEELLSSKPGVRRALDFTSTISPAVSHLTGEDASAMVLELRRRKELDEIEEIRISLSLCALAYDTARRAVAPGMTEVAVFSAMNSALAERMGRPVAFPGDFACGPKSLRGGGPPTDRVCEAGELYPLDLFPAPDLYFGDTCRTLCVGGRPTAGQRDSHQRVAEALASGESMLKPGVAGREIYRAVRDHLNCPSFFHHAGHGIGLHGHEAPRLIPESDDVLAPGDVVTIEPGLYREANRGGLRLENNYLITESGFVKLFDEPLDF